MLSVEIARELRQAETSINAILAPPCLDEDKLRRTQRSSRPAMLMLALPLVGAITAGFIVYSQIDKSGSRASLSHRKVLSTDPNVANAPTYPSSPNEKLTSRDRTYLQPASEAAPMPAPVARHDRASSGGVTDKAGITNAPRKEPARIAVGARARVEQNTRAIETTFAVIARQSVSPSDGALLGHGSEGPVSEVEKGPRPDQAYSAYREQDWEAQPLKSKASKQSKKAAEGRLNGVDALRALRHQW